MKLTSKLVAGMVLCAGFVQVTSPGKKRAKKVPFNITMVKEDPKMVFDYVVDMGTEDSGYQRFRAKDEDKTIKFDAKSSINTLYVYNVDASGNRDSVAQRLVLDSTKPKNSIIFISNTGIPIYWTKEAFKTFRDSQPKSRL